MNTVNGSEIPRWVTDAQAQLRWPDKRMRPLLVAGVVVLLVVLSLKSAIYSVQPEEQAVVKRFGAVVRVTDPGLRFKLPLGIERIERVATERVMKEEFGFRTEDTRGRRTRYSARDFEDESLMLTGDLNMISVEWVVQYRIRNPVDFLYEIRGADDTLRAISESVMRRIVGNRLGSDVLTVARVEMQQQARDEIQQVMDRYKSGIHIITVELQDVVPPKAVQPAFNEVNESRQERERMINEAQKRVNQQIPRAEGEALAIIAEAQGYAIERVNRAMGETARFRAVQEAYRQAPEVTRTRLYLEAMAELIPRMGRVLVVRGDQISPLPLLNVDPERAQEVQR